jgi:hypothetical protein
MSRNLQRLSQLITTFGPGSMLDLPTRSVMVGGLDRWEMRQGTWTPIDEPRLVEMLQRRLTSPGPNGEPPRMPEGTRLSLRTPPLAKNGNGSGEPPGVPVSVFPIFSPDGMQIISGARVLDAASGRALTDFDPPREKADTGWAPPGEPSMGFGPLGLAVKDATAFAAAMKHAAAGMYDDVRVTLALDRDASRDKLHKLVAKLAAEIHPRDSFILFAAAHGKSEDGRFYLIPQDYQSGPGHLAKYAVGQDDLQDWLANRIKARKALILLDTCESGALIAGHKRAHRGRDQRVGRAAPARGHRPARAYGRRGRPGGRRRGDRRHGRAPWLLHLGGARCSAQG